MTQPLISSPAPSPVPVDLVAIKARQQATWASGDFAVIGTTLQLVGESLCEAVDLRGGQRVLDVACGNGNATLAAARRFADVTGVDYVPALLAAAQRRAAAEGLAVELHEGDCEALAFADGAFDVVLSTFGCMFAPDQERTASELVRVCRPGGRIGLASWTAEGFIGALFRTVGRLAPPPAGIRSPLQWGSPDRLRELFPHAASITSTRREFAFRYRSPEHFVEVFRTYYGPTHKAFKALDATGRQMLQRDLLALLDEWNSAADGTLVASSEYLESVIVTA
jgi:ubiquinone/menaquinone biosynthesis C-methylase UbiE